MRKNKIKLLLTIRQGKIGGGETHVLELVKRLDKEIYEPVVLTFTDGEMVNVLKGLSIKTHIIHTETPFDFRCWNKVKSFIKKEKIQLIHAHGTRACSNTFWAAKKLKIPIIYTVHGWSFHPNQPKVIHRLRELGESFLCKNVQKTICVSNSCYNEAKTKFDLPNTVVIHNSVNHEKFNPDGRYSDIRTELNISKDTTLVGYIVRMTQQKDPFTLLSAIRKVVETNENIHFLFVGGGDLKDDIAEYIKKHGLHEHITFQDFRQDIPDILNAIDIYCLPSLWEGLSIGVLEAMAMKKCIIATSIPGNEELVSHNLNGLVVPVKDPVKLSEAIVFLHKNKNIAEKYGNESLKIAKSQYDIDKMIQKIQNVYQDLTQHNIIIL